MGRTLHRLSAKAVANLKNPGLYADGGNLYLRVAPGGSRAWIFRFARHGRMRDAGLGSYPAVSLAAARDAAQQYRRQLAEGIDPIAARDAERRLQCRADTPRDTFRHCAQFFISSHEAGWRNDKHRAQWRATLEAYAHPVIGDMPVSAIETGHVLKVLEPIWCSKSETASRLRGRMEAILDWARVQGLREGENPARWRGHLAHLLPAKRKVRAVEHHAALPWPEVPAFMSRLRQQSSVSASALEFLILSSCRTGEVLGARWDEIDLAAALWIIPADRMKNGRVHRVPIGTRSMEILASMASIQSGPFVFPGMKKGQPLSQMSLLMLLRRLEFGHVTVHGFRSSFRDWAAEWANAPREVAELVLAHSVGTAVETAYRRGDLLERRRRLMAEWEAYCAKSAPRRETVTDVEQLSGREI